jgi:hypothetical protein
MDSSPPDPTNKFPHLRSHVSTCPASLTRALYSLEWITAALHHSSTNLTFPFPSTQKIDPAFWQTPKDNNVSLIIVALELA